jgi:hypothetical protein
MKKPFYRYFLKAVKQSGVTKEDTVEEVLTKLRHNVTADMFKSVSPFVRDYWDTERNYIDKGADNLKRGIYTDPTSPDSTVVRTPSNRMVMVHDYTYSSCPYCSGRLFPGMSYCPWCGAGISSPVLEPCDVFPDIPRKGSGIGKGRGGVGLGLGRQVPNRRGRGILPLNLLLQQNVPITDSVIESSHPDDMYYEDEDDGIQVTVKDLSDKLIDIDRFIPD